MQFQEAIKTIKERLSLVDLASRYVDLKPHGGRFLGPCPFHQETKPSFYIFPDRGSFYCFGCQASGDIFEFYSRISGVDFRDALAALAEEAGITIDARSRNADGGLANHSEKQQILALHKLACDHYKASLASDRGAECRAYMDSRGISPEIRERFELGWAERDWHSLRNFLAARGISTNLAIEAGLLAKSAQGKVYDRFRGRLIFPIKNLSNQIIAFGGRIIGDADEAKYINSPESPIYSKKDNLFGLSQARRAISAKGHALLTEGYMDVLTLHQFGYENSTGALGTALTEDQIKRLGGFTSHVRLLFDGDQPGRKAALRAAEMFLGRGLSCRVILLPDQEDIDSLLRKYGTEAFDKLQAQAPDGLDFCIETARSFAPLDALNWARRFLANLRVPELAGQFASKLALRLGLSERDLREAAVEHPVPIRSQPERDYRELCALDTQIMVFAARYPDRLDDLREIGADIALTAGRARKLWGLIETHGPDVVYYLDERQKRFWMSQAGPEAPPRLSWETELGWLKHSLDRFHAKNQARALRQTFAANGDFGSELEFLHAIRDTMRNTDEQS